MEAKDGNIAGSQECARLWDTQRHPLSLLSLYFCFILHSLFLGFFQDSSLTWVLEAHLDSFSGFQF